MIYQDAVASQHADKVQSVNAQSKGGRRNFLIENWDAILKIDYEPIFKIARDILDVIPNTDAWNARLESLSTVAANVRGSGVLAKHDFMGRLFHKILLRTAGESYATYYTAVPSAYLLARIVVGLSDADFRSPEAVGGLRIGDFACGSGTLLSASYTAIRDRYVAESAGTLDLPAVHQTLIEQSIFGMDVLDYAAHLTLTTLALHRGDQPLQSSNIWRVPAGYDKRTGVHLGSLDLYFHFLSGLTFRQQEQAKTLSGDGTERIKLPQFDILIMNPPFSRSSGPKISFGYDLPNKPLMMQQMKAIAKQEKFRKMLVAGMGAFFVPLAIKYCRDGGRIAFVLPRSMLSGVSWEEVRTLVDSTCHLEIVVSNHDPGHAPALADGKRGRKTRGWAFSEETDIGEVLFIARKRSQRQLSEKTLFVNLFEFPANEFAAIAVADQVVVQQRAGADAAITFDDRAVGTAYTIRQQALKRFNWLFPCVFASRDLAEYIIGLVRDPGLVSFSTFATSYGCDISAEKQVFDRSTVQTAFPMLWTHGMAQNRMALDVTQIEYGTPKKDRERAQTLFSTKSGRLLIAERPHLKTTPSFAVLAPFPVLATPFWEVRLTNLKFNRIAALWLNSSYGILLTLAISTSSQGEIFKLKNDQLRSLPVIDFTKIDYHAAAALWERISDYVLDDVGKSWSDAAEQKGARYELDEFFAPYIQKRLTTAEYRLLATEPIVTHLRR